MSAAWGSNVLCIPRGGPESTSLIDHLNLIFSLKFQNQTFKIGIKLPLSGISLILSYPTGYQYHVIFGFSYLVVAYLSVWLFSALFSYPTAYQYRVT